MTAPANDREWLNAIQANRRDLALAFDQGDEAAKEQLRKEYDQLVANKPTSQPAR